MPVPFRRHQHEFTAQNLQPRALVDQADLDHTLDICDGEGALSQSFGSASDGGLHGPENSLDRRQVRGQRAPGGVSV